MATIIQIELRVKTSGSVLSWEVFLENTSSSSEVRHWIYDSTHDDFCKILKQYPIDDDYLDVYVGCEGKEGGSTSCKVIINDVPQAKKVICKNTDRDYAHVSYKI